MVIINCDVHTILQIHWINIARSMPKKTALIVKIHSSVTAGVGRNYRRG